MEVWANSRWKIILWMGLSLSIIALPVWAGPTDPSTKPTDKGTNQLVDRQRDLTERYADFESTVKRMADLLGKSDPDRSAVLAKVFSSSRSKLLLDQFQSLVKKLEAGDVPTALSEQQTLLDDLHAILDMLLAEDRQSQAKLERERLEKLKQDIKELRAKQSELRWSTEQVGRGKPSEPGATPKDQTKSSPKSNSPSKDQADKDLSARQKRLADQGKNLAEKAEKSNDSPKDAKEDDAPGETEPGKRSPKKALSQAEKAMRNAGKRLEQQQNKEATADQDEAIKQLDQAKKELEEKLKQLRDEERLQTLQSLASRCRKMLEIADEIKGGSVKLSAIARDKWMRAEEQSLGLLADRQGMLLELLEQTTSIVREEGTSVSFLEAFLELSEDAKQVEDRLKRKEVDSLTLHLEDEILAGLKEIIESLDRKIKEAAQNSGNKPGGGSAGNSPLVGKIAELKLVRSLEDRIARRTVELSKAQAQNLGNSELRQALLDLSARQERVYRMTKALAEGTSP